MLPGLAVSWTNFLAMILGGCLEADHRIREFEAKVRMQKRMLRNRAAWDEDQEEYENIANSKPKT